MKAKAYIVNRAMAEPPLEWSKPGDCLSAEPLYTSPQPAQEPVSTTDELVDAYCKTWEQSFTADNPYHTVRMTAEDRKHITAGLEAALAKNPAQPSKPWVGLTQEDMYEIGEFKNTHGYVPTGFKRLAAAIEAKLREKNT